MLSKSRYSECAIIYRYSTSEIIVSSSLKLLIVAVIGLKEYCKLKNKFWNASKKGPI